MKALRYLAAWLVLLPAVTSCKEYNICPNGTAEEITGVITGSDVNPAQLTYSDGGDYNEWTFTQKISDLCPDGLLIYEIRVVNIYAYGYTRQVLMMLKEGDAYFKVGKGHRGAGLDITSYSFMNRAGWRDNPFDLTLTITLYYRKSPQFTDPREQLKASLNQLAFEFDYIKNN